MKKDVKKKSMIDKTNPLWSWRKTDKREKDQYKDLTELEVQEVGVMNDKAYKLYLRLIGFED